MLTVDVLNQQVTAVKLMENTIKEKTIAKMFVLWPSGDPEAGYQEEIVWKIYVDKHLLCSETMRKCLPRSQTRKKEK